MFDQKNWLSGGNTLHQKDWLMRQIESLISAILRFLLHDGQDMEQIEEKVALSDMVNVDQLDAIAAFLQKNEICEAENWLYENMDKDDLSWLYAAMYFYSEINKLSDVGLSAHNFSREEIEAGLQEACKIYGYAALL